MRRFFPQAAAGFTLLEMLVLLAVAGLVAALVLTHGPPRSVAVELQAATRQMAGTLRGARAAAIAAGAPVTVVLDLRQHSLQAGAAPPVLLPATVALSAYALSGAPLGPRRAAIRFAPDGSASAVRIGLADGASRAAVLVDWLTGRIVVLDRAVADAG